MARPNKFPAHVRDSAIGRYKNGENVARIAKDVGVSRAGMYLWINAAQATKSPRPEELREILSRIESKLDKILGSKWNL